MRDLNESRGTWKRWDGGTLCLNGSRQPPVFDLDLATEGVMPLE